MDGTSGKVELVVDGMTGVGKTSLVQLLAGDLGLTPFDELFRDRFDILRKFYHDRSKWAFPMQVMFLNNRFSQYRSAGHLAGVIMDRSIFSDPIFARMYREEGYMTEEEHGIYHQLLENFLAEISPPVLMVYLRVSYEEALRRIRLRGRDDELAVEPAYWRKLWEIYEQHYRTYRAGPLLAFDVSKMDFVNRKEDYHTLLNKIRGALDAARREQTA